MTAAIPDLELVGEVHLLARLDGERDPPASPLDPRPGVGVQGEFRVHQIVMGPQDPIDAVTGRLLVPRQHHDQVAIGDEPLLQVAGERFDQRRVARLVVAGAAAVKPPVFLQ